MSENDPQYKSDDGSALRIYYDTMQNKFHSERVGRAVFDEVILVEVISPGSHSSIPVFEVKRTFCAEAGIPEPRYGSHYAQYKKFVEDFESSEKVASSLTGTPLKEWPEITRSMAAALRANQIFTVEALANIPDTALGLVGPDGRTWRTKAKAFIEAASNASYATGLAAELERVREDAAADKALIADLVARLDSMEAGKNSTKPASTFAPTLDNIDLTAATGAPSPVRDTSVEAEALVPAATATKSTPAKKTAEPII